MHDKAKYLKEVMDRIARYFPEDFIRYKECKTTFSIYIGDADFQIDKNTGKFIGAGRSLEDWQDWQILPKNTD